MGAGRPWLGGLEMAAQGSPALGWAGLPLAGRLVPSAVRCYRCPQNASSVAFLTSRWKVGVPVPAGGGMLILKSL